MSVLPRPNPGSAPVKLTERTHRTISVPMETATVANRIFSFASQRHKSRSTASKHAKSFAVVFAHSATALEGIRKNVVNEPAKGCERNNEKHVVTLTRGFLI